jgi:protein gp37
MADTKIEWCDKVWNPTTGCSKISAGCANCYAERIANRFWGDRKFNDIKCHPERLNEPMKWRKPQKIFGNSMSDLFHEDVPFEFIDRVFGVMAACKKHIFMILTKRPERALEYYIDKANYWSICKYAFELYSKETPANGFTKPSMLNNVWLGVTAENQQTADKRISILLQIPAAVRFVSVEPMLGAVNLTKILLPTQYQPDWFMGREAGSFFNSLCSDSENRWDSNNHLDWVICGPETGPGKRLMKNEWILDLYQQCTDAGVPFFDKKNVLGLNLKQFPEVPQ